MGNGQSSFPNAVGVWWSKSEVAVNGLAPVVRLLVVIQNGVGVDRRLGSVVSVVGFEDFYRRVYPGTVALARALVGARLAEDVAQEAMWVTFRKWDDIDSPELWLRRVVVNKSNSLLRRLYAEARAVARLGARHDVVEVPVETDEFWTLARGLPRRQSQVLALLFVADLSTADVAAVIGCSEATVRVHLHRARATLQSRLEKEGRHEY